MYRQIRPALVVFGLLTILTGVIYPLAITALAQTFFPSPANGSLIAKDGHVVGSGLIGQTFDAPRYFWARPSTTGPGPYNAASSTGANLGPTNPALLDAIQGRVAAIRQAHPDQPGPVPADLVTASASGLDPHISPAAAEYQVTRVATARGVSPDALRRLVAEHTEGRTLGLLGEPCINVLKLNLSLDQLQ
jgi:potassium-transporting ATPase KdpC subunit